MSVMKELQFPVSVRWQGGKLVTAEARAGMLPVATPPEFDGGLAAIGALDGVAERLQHVDAEHDHRPRVIDDQDLLPGRCQFAWARAGAPAAPFVRVS